jgi:hypothetical protein
MNATMVTTHGRTNSRAIQMEPTIDYGVACVRDLQIRRVEKSRGGKVTLRDIELDGRCVTATKRFWRSFFTRFGIAENVFRYFSPAEVFERISNLHADDSFQYCIAGNIAQGRSADKPKDHLLAITNIKRPIIRYGEVRALLERFGGEDISYVDGVVTSTHQPRGGSRALHIGGDEFRDRFCLETPIDGYGHPRLFLSMLRTVCSNGMIGYARAFRSDIPVGKNMEHCISRAIESYDNSDGYAALRQRFESSQSSWASVRECLLLGSLLDKLGKERALTTDGLMPKFRQMAGNLSELYGLANLEALSDKRRRVLPAKCRIYHLLNFSSEVATHHATPLGTMKMQAYLGTLISDEYDLEGTAENAADFDAFFMGPKDEPMRPSLN